MTTISYQFRASSKIGEQSGSLYLRLTHNRESRQIALGLKIDRADWDAHLQRSNNEAINSQLGEVKTTIRQIIDSLSARGYYTVDDVAIRYRLHTGGNTLLSFAQLIAANYTRRGQERTARAYLSSVKRLLTFCKDTDLQVSQITASLMEDFEKALSNEGKSRNTISFYMRNLRALYNKAVAMEQIVAPAQSPFAKVFTGIEITRKRALTRKDINAINTAKLSDPALHFARQLFFFSFHARGMSFVDMAYLKKSDLKNEIITYRRKKTGREIEIKLNSELRQLIKAFSSQTRGSQYLLPIITQTSKLPRQQYESALCLQNKRLKKIGKLAKLSTPISTHVARHTWASLAKEIHTPLAVISESLGHNDQKTTYIYLASFDRSVLDKVGDSVSQLIKTVPVPLYNQLYSY